MAGLGPDSIEQMRRALAAYDGSVMKASGAMREMRETFDHQVDALRLARAQAYAPPAAEDAAHIDLCSDWMREHGLDGRLERTIESDGVVRWRVRVHTERGDAIWPLASADEWVAVAAQWDEYV